jgi:hypothetical protein
MRPAAGSVRIGIEIKYIEFFNCGKSVAYGPDAILDQFEFLNAEVSISENSFLRVVPDNMEELQGWPQDVSGVALIGKDSVTKDYNDIFGGSSCMVLAE